MKISNKISILILFLLLTLAINAYVSINVLMQMGKTLNDIIANDIQLIEIVTEINQSQLESNILLERIIRISEELAFEEVSIGRKAHLLDATRITETGFNNLSLIGAQKIVEGKELVEKKAKDYYSHQEKSLNLELEINAIEQAHIQYVSTVGSIFSSINTGAYEFSLEDIQLIQLNERRLTKRLKLFLNSVQQLTRRSLDDAHIKETKTNYFLRLNLFVSVLISTILAFLIIKSISEPLSRLTKAAVKMGEGDLTVTVDYLSRDEIGEVSKAFNTMSGKLAQAVSDLQKNLKITNDQKKDLEKINKELDRFAHTVSHDLRSPLMGITGYSSLLDSQYGPTLDARAKRSIQGIRKGAERLNKMIDDLLTLTRISRIKNPYERVNMRVLVLGILDRLEFKIQENHISITVDEQLPEIVCDRIKISEVFHNLISNAIKFTVKTQSKPAIEIGFITQEDAVEFFVKDNGIGIDPDDQEKVFDIFQRLGNAEDYEGTGAGLSIVKSIIDDHHGRIWIESEKGRGTVFKFTIPHNLTC